MLFLLKKVSLTEKCHEISIACRTAIRDGFFMYLQSHFSKTDPMKFRGFFIHHKPKSIYTCITNIQSRQQLLSEMIKNGMVRNNI